MIRDITRIWGLLKEFFPIQLLILNLKKNQILLLFWFGIFAIITGNVGRNLGIPYLFLDPEYKNQVNFWSLFILGVAYGILVISFFITSYILDSHRFQFLGTIRRPFAHFCLNNAIIPAIIYLVYIIEFAQFQTTYGDQSISMTIKELFGFTLGIASIIQVTFYYFKKTNKDLFKEIAKNINIKLRKKKINTVSVLRKINDQKKRYNISNYLSFPLKISKVDQELSYDRNFLFRIIDQHHLNAVTVELTIFIIILIIGAFRDNVNFQIPAAASVMLLAAFFIMFAGAITYWLRGWAITGILVMAFCFNLLMKYEIINSNKEAFGMNYKSEKAEYSYNRIEQMSDITMYNKDMESTIQILKNWRKKFPKNKKPKLVFICASGGGHRAAVWTMKALQYVDSSSNGKLLNHSILMTGASGGLIGASYYRELYLQNKQGLIDDLYSRKYLDNMGKDVLNPMVFSLAVSDLLFGFQKFKVDNYEYYKGRGYSFENQIHQNTGGVLNKKVRDYKIPEQNALIPMVFMTPTIINDGRKLYISAQNISYMNSAPIQEMERLNTRTKGIEFNRFFKEQDADNLLFMSALRMSATFPYITPNVHLPSKPEMVIMDAGMTDNFGMNDAIRFFHTFKDWIEDNTNGVVFVSIRDTEKNPFIKQDVSEGLWNVLFNPIANLYNNLDNIQDLANDNAIEFADSWIKDRVDIISFEYSPKNWELLAKKPNSDLKMLEKEYNKERAALSWHLTHKEKEGINKAIYNSKNQKSLKRLLNLLKSDE